MRACRAADSGAPVSISDDLYRVLAKAQSISEGTDGAFDVTIGPLVRQWRNAKETGVLPSDQARARAMTRVGWRRLRIRPRPFEMRFETGGMRLDLGGIGKGFAADEAMAVLEGRGIDSCLVELGGDMLLGEPPPDQKAWRISVEPSNRPESSVLLKLSRAAIATSGDIEQFLEIGGRRYSHIIDPRTGLGLTNRISVAVIAPDGATADALASAISVLGPEDGLAVLQRFPGSAALIEVYTPAGTERYLSNSFPLSAHLDIK
jgi:thiamine biosynthesis lipoprotein